MYSIWVHTNKIEKSTRLRNALHQPLQEPMALPLIDPKIPQAPHNCSFSYISLKFRYLQFTNNHNEIKMLIIVKQMHMESLLTLFVSGVCPIVRGLLQC